MPLQTLRSTWNSLVSNDQLPSGPWGEEGPEEFDWEADVLEAAFAAESTINGELYYPPIVDVAAIKEAKMRGFLETLGLKIP